MDKASVLFCVGSLALFVLIAFVAFPFAAMDAETVAASQGPKSAYEMGSVDVGEGFGEVAIEELMAYYVENPPAAPTAGAAAAPEIRFGGC